MEKGRLKELFHRWGAPPALQSLQTFQEHVVSTLCTLHQDYCVFELARPLLLTGWCQLWRGRVESLKVDEMLVQEYCGMGVENGESTIEHEMREK